jgi:hypothetical protein
VGTSLLHHWSICADANPLPLADLSEKPAASRKTPEMPQETSQKDESWLSCRGYPFGLPRITRGGYRRSDVPLSLIGSLCNNRPD